MQSVDQCYLYGDSDLYGFGVRLSYYLQFGAGLIGLACGLDKELESLRRGFNIITFTILVYLFISANRGSFALLEWYIVSLLILLLPGVVLPFPYTYTWEIIQKTGEGNQLPEGAGTANQQASTVGDEEAKPTSEDSPANEPPTLELKRQINTKPFLQDPIGVGFLYAVYSVYAFSQPWLYFTVVDAGHKQGCIARVLAFFVSVDLYNKHWLRFFKASGLTLTIVAPVFFAYPAILWIIQGICFRPKLNELLKDLEKLEDDEVKELKVLRSHHLRGNQNSGKKVESQAQKKATPSTRPSASVGEDDVHQAEHQYQEAALEAQREDDHINRLRLLERKRKLNKITRWAIRGTVFVLYGFSGASTIYFVEKTIQVNDIAMNDSVASSTGQLLALLVAVFTTVTVVWEAAKNYWWEKRLKNRKWKAAFADALYSAWDRQGRARDKIARALDRLGAVRFSGAPVQTSQQARQGFGRLITPRFQVHFWKERQADEEIGKDGQSMGRPGTSS